MDSQQEATAAPETPAVETVVTSVSNDIGTGKFTVSEKDLADFGVNLNDEEALPEMGEQPQEAASNEADTKEEDPKDDQEESIETKDESTEEKKDEAEEEDDELAQLKKDLYDSDDESETEFEITVKGEKIKLPESEIVELAQKGKDYTQKTQALSEERKSFEKEKESYIKDAELFMQENQQNLYEKLQLDHFLDHLQKTDPESYQEFQEKAQAFIAATSNPLLEAKIAEFDKRLKELDTRQDSVLEQRMAAKLEEDLVSLRSEFENKYAKYGIKLNEQKLIDEWVQTEAPIKEIFRKQYADHILSLAESKAKVTRVKKKANAKIPTAGKTKVAASTPQPDKKQNLKHLSYHNIADMILSGELR